MKKKIVVAMSGGVDSSVAAAILKNKGYETVGVTLRLFREKIKCCGGDDSLYMAKRVCGVLGIRHYFKNAQSLFEKKVISNFKEEYFSGRTPNPCVECNRHLKFSYLLDFSEQLGADFLATGHYAAIKSVKDGKGLFRGKDSKKDQSYFLYPVKKENLKKILFPLGKFTKNEIRQMAGEMELPAYRSKESKDICFVANSRYGRFISKGVKSEKGRIMDTSGKFLGYHKGFFNFTVGQRRGLGVYSKERLYVVSIDSLNNTIVLGNLKEAHFNRFSIKKINWLSSFYPSEGDILSAQIRYGHTPQKCEIVKKDKDFLFCEFEKPQFALAKGQSAVFYKKERVFGGGIIEETR